MAKRGAAVQINKDNYDPDAEADNEPTGTWQKADESVLAQRKIRKAKRPAAGSGALPGAPAEPDAAAKPNPFASIALVAPPASASAFGAATTAFGSAPTAFGASAPTSTFGGGSGFTFGCAPPRSPL